MSDGFSLTYQMTRADYAAMFRALMGRPWWHRWVMLVGWIALWLAVMLFSSPSMEQFWRAIGYIWEGRAGWGFYAGLLMLPLLFFWEDLAAFANGVSFAKNEIAKKPTTVRVDHEGVRLSVAEVSSQVGWSAIVKVIETATRLFLVISARQAVVLPRAAFASDAEYAAARAFVLERIGEIPVERK